MQPELRASGLQDNGLMQCVDMAQKDLSNFMPIYFFSLIFYLFSLSYPITCSLDTQLFCYFQNMLCFLPLEFLPVLIALHKMAFTFSLPGHFHRKTSPKHQRIAALTLVQTSVLALHCIIVICVSVFHITLNFQSRIRISFLWCMAPG